MSHPCSLVEIKKNFQRDGGSNGKDNGFLHVRMYICMYGVCRVHTIQVELLITP